VDHTNDGEAPPRMRCRGLARPRLARPPIARPPGAAQPTTGTGRPPGSPVARLPGRSWGRPRVWHPLSGECISTACTALAQEFPRADSKFLWPSTRRRPLSPVSPSCPPRCPHFYPQLCKCGGATAAGTRLMVATNGVRNTQRQDWTPWGFTPRRRDARTGCRTVAPRPRRRSRRPRGRRRSAGPNSATMTPGMTWRRS
jgi:hypothetical protein